MNEMLLNATIIWKQAVSKIVIKNIKRQRLEILFCDFHNFSHFFTFLKCCVWIRNAKDLNTPSWSQGWCCISYAMPLPISTDFLKGFKDTPMPNAFKSQCLKWDTLNTTIMRKRVFFKNCDQQDGKMEARNFILLFSQILFLKCCANIRLVKGSNNPSLKPRVMMQYQCDASVHNELSSLSV
jgi:hypothetical protein